MASRRAVRIWAVGLVPVLVLVAIVAVVLLRNRDDAGSGGSAERAPGPVLLVAGYGGSTTALTTMATALRGRGRAVVIVPATGDNTGDLNGQAQTLEKAVEEQVAGGAGSVDVVGYSAGGVVVRIWANGPGAELARRVVTLGSPHHGTDVAGLAAGFASSACPAACKQLAPGSDLLDDLPDTPSDASWLSIWTTDDDTVIPVSTSRLQGAINVGLQQVCAGVHVSHSDLPRDPLTIGLVEYALDGPPLAAPPTAGECTRLRTLGSGN